jgi:rod shape-determining protein MreC
MNMASRSAEQVRWRLFLLFAVVTAILLALDVTGNLSTVVGYLRIPFTATQDWISGRVRRAESTLATSQDLSVLQAENEQLRSQVAELERQNEELMEVYAEYTLLSALLDYARENPQYRRVAADIIGWDTSNFVRTIVINRGEEEGIAVGMPVETERGLVGRVVAVSPHAAQVQLLTDPGSAINARLGASRADGVVEGQLTGHLRMKWLEQDIPISENELVMTSGLGGNFPPDLVIGRVAQFEQSASELFQEAEVRPAVDFDRLEIVLIITDFQPAVLDEEESDQE